MRSRLSFHQTRPAGLSEGLTAIHYADQLQMCTVHFVSQSNIRSIDALTDVIMSMAVTLRSEIRFIFMAHNYGRYKTFAYSMLN